MEKKNKICFVAIDEAYLLRLQVTDESDVKCFFEVTISKEIEKVSKDKKEKLLKRVDELFYSYLDKFQKEIIREQKSKSVKQGSQTQAQETHI